MNPKISTSFGKYADADLATKAQHIVTSLTGNAAYPTPVPALTAVQTATDNFTTALANMGDGGKQTTLIKNQARQTLEQLLNQLALYVQMQGGSNAITLQSSGYDLQKGHTTPVGILSKPGNVKIVPGPVPGSVKVSFDAIYGANTYLFQYAETPVTDATVWEDLYDGKCTKIISELTSGKQYAFTVAGIGTDPTIVYSDVITSFVL